MVSDTVRPLRVIVADDSQFMRVAYRRIFETQEHLEGVAEASDGEQVLAVALEFKPDVASWTFGCPS